MQTISHEKLSELCLCFSKRCNHNQREDRAVSNVYLHTTTPYLKKISKSTGVCNPLHMQDTCHPPTKNAKLFGDQDGTPPPMPEFLLSKDFRLQPNLECKFLLRRTWSGQKPLPQDFQSLSKGNQVPLVGPFLSDPSSEGTMGRLGGWALDA